ncbi:hypothetical protein CLV32_1574 [Pedobacter duraquae]|uniref:Uncharacterized protein n=1 Tax=Pedobacter duraquae TaxID=425511 RepID=A0A4V3C3M3_9SPHI|nr:hypothetical protein CLV32_1574 [Pedobacter duraquae]
MSMHAAMPTLCHLLIIAFKSTIGAHKITLMIVNGHSIFIPEQSFRSVVKFK